jgi:hypothetical protein
VNGETYYFPLQISSDGNREKWLKDALRELDTLPEAPEFLDPESLWNNPLAIWGAAAMEGFFSDDEIPQVVEFLDQRYGRLPQRSDAITLSYQVEALLSLVATHVTNAPVHRFITLCTQCELPLPVRDSDGHLLGHSVDLKDFIQIHRRPE